MRKIEARTWNSSKESFHEYATDKLMLMQNLNLPKSDAIQYLISDIINRSLRATASVLEVNTISLFLQKMHKITALYGDLPQHSLNIANKADEVKSHQIFNKKNE